MASPAVPHFLRATPLLPSQPMPSDMDLLWRTGVLWHLSTTLTRFTSVRPRLRDPLPVSQRQAHCDSAGLPVYMNPLFSESSLGTDVLLLHASSVGREQGTCPASRCLEAQSSMLDCWITFCRLYPPSEVTPAAMASSIVGLVTQCTQHALRMLLKAQSPTLCSLTGACLQVGQMPPRVHGQQ